MYESDNEENYEEEPSLINAALEAASRKKEIENQERAGLPPRLKLQKKLDHDNDKMKKLREKVPPMPPKKLESPLPGVEEYHEQEAWYYIKSPREKFGVTGPKTGQDLSFLYKVNEINESTLLWRNGLDGWAPLHKVDGMRTLIDKMPVVPEKSVEERKTMEITKSESEKAIPLGTFRTELWCSVCRGSLATHHIPGMGEPDPDLFGLRQSVGSTKETHEVIPGYMFTGNKDAAKLSTVIPGGFTMVLNCTEKFKNPAPRPPHFRCSQSKLIDRMKVKSMPKDYIDRVKLARLRKNGDLTPLGEGEKVNKADMIGYDDFGRKMRNDLDGDGTDDDSLISIPHSDDASSVGHAADMDLETFMETQKNNNHEEDENHQNNENWNDARAAAIAIAEAEEEARAELEQASLDVVSVEEDLELENVIKMLDKTSDLIEIERIKPQLHELGDPIPEPYRGPVDKYGRPQVDSDTSVPTYTATQRKNMGLEKQKPSRILVWSRRGDNRCAVVAAAYFIKRYGVTLQKALSYVRQVPGIKITPGYMWVLEQYSKKYSLGLAVCGDCLINATDDTHEEQIQMYADILLKARGPDYVPSKPDGDSVTLEETTVTTLDAIDDIESVANVQDHEEIEKSNTNDNNDDNNISNTNVNDINGNNGDNDASSNVIISKGNEIIEIDDQKNDDVFPSSTATSPSSRRRGNTGKPFVDFVDLRDVEQKAEEEARHRARIEAMAPLIKPSAEASQRLRRRLRRSRMRNDKFDDLEAAAAACNELVNICVESISDVLCLCPVPEYVSQHESYKMLTDLTLAGRSLKDDTIKLLFDELNSLDASRTLRRVDMRNNLMGNDGVSSLCYALYPDYKKPMTPGEEYADTEILILHLANNRIQEEGGAILGLFLRHNKSITELDLSNNPLSDAGSAAVIEALVKPGQSMEDEAAAEEAGGKDGPALIAPYNRSITNLNICSVGMSGDGTDRLALMLSGNPVIFRINMDSNGDLYGKLPAKPLKNVFRAIKTLNRTLTILSLADIILLPNHFELILGILEDGDSPLNDLCLAGCGLTALHMSKMDGALAASKLLKRLDISRNPIGLKGAEHLVEEFDTSVGDEHKHHHHGHGHQHEHAKGIEVAYHYGNDDDDEEAIELYRKSHHALPLEYLDVSTCHLGSEGVLTLLKGLKTKEKVKYLDISENDMFDSSTQVAKALNDLKLREIHLNQCKLGTMGSKKILDALAVSEIEPLNVNPGYHIRVLSLSGNEISNSIGPTLDHFLKHNMRIAILDLGFNNITNDIINTMPEKGLPTILSSSSEDMKLRSLHINLQGNQCSQSLFETPGLARSKITFAFARVGVDGDMSHVPSKDVKEYKKRMVAEQDFYEKDPVRDINFVA